MHATLREMGPVRRLRESLEETFDLTFPVGKLGICIVYIASLDRQKKGLSKTLPSSTLLRPVVLIRLPGNINNTDSD